MWLPAPTSDTALAFERVSKRYRKGTLALDQVSWSIAAGSRTCLLGPNGAGKSTAIRLLQGAIAPTGGRVSLLGAPVGGPGYLAARRRTGLVPQGPGMYADLTTGEYLTLARRLYGRGSIDRVTEAFELARYWNTRMAELSGGFQRRAVLAAALLAEPDLLLLDEPTVGLDPLAAHDVHEYLRAAMEGRTTLLCTHNLVEAEALCDQVIILREGRVLVQDALQSLRGRMQAQLELAARQGAAALLAALQARGMQAHPSGQDGSVRVGVGDVQAEAPALLRGLLADGLDVYECRKVEVTLETVFLELVRGAP
jgi:ABC-2 type transport system ATP-binding protein